LTLDFTGSDDRPEIVAYSTFRNMRGCVVAQLAAMTDPTSPRTRVSSTRSS